MSEITFKGKQLHELNEAEMRELSHIVGRALSKVAKQLGELADRMSAGFSEVINKGAQDRGLSASEFIEELRKEIRAENEAKAKEADEEWQKSLESLKAMQAAKKRALG